MKMAGHVFDAPNTEVCVLPRGNNRPNVVFIAQAVLDFDEFNKLCPEPRPPVLVKPDGSREHNYKDETYLTAISEHGTRRMDWMILKSLEATPDLEWETVKLTDPSTWANFRKELQEAHFSVAEINRIQNAAFDVNSLNEFKIEEARKNFLRGQAASKATSSGQLTEAASSPSGEPANA